MGTIKTAISIDSVVFEKVNRLTRKLHISRSHFFTQAAKFMIKRDDNLELLKKINDSYKDDNDTTRRKAEKKYFKKKVVDKW
jgi:metal-responsive CopG/Arc/MetJ family transcriptional regulator